MYTWNRLTVLIAFLGVGSLAADTVQLRSGRRVEGTFIGGDSRQIRLLGSDGNVQSIDITSIESIRFGTPAAAQAAPPAPARVTPRPAATPVGKVVIPAGTVITVRMIDGVDSNVTGTGEKFRASLDAPLQVGTQVVAQRGADATVQVVRVEQSGRLTGRDEVALDLLDITIGGKRYEVASSYAEVQSDSRSRDTAKKVGGGAALGAIIGAIAGGGKGAAIGATAGAGAGGAIQVLTKGERVKIPAESRLDFTLKQPLSVE
jgi:hypothetical protein